MTFTNITCAGAGTMGSQVAWQMAFHGKHVTVYDAIPSGLENGRAFHREYAKLFVEDRGATEAQVQGTFDRLAYTSDLTVAVRDADLVSESVPESPDIKASFWRDVSAAAPERTVFATNTSTLTPSQLVQSVDRPDRFIALHFAIGVWDSNIGEVMGHAGTDAAVFDDVVAFAREIGLIPIPIHKEQSGYLVNSLLLPWCAAALDLVARGVSDHESVDRAWMLTLRTDLGPFGMMDRMGLGVVHHVATLLAENPKDLGAAESARFLADEFLSKGRLGVTTGHGFYRYPDPSYAQPGFI